MEVPGKVPETINCHACGAVIDLTGKVGFTHVDCPRCDAVSVVPVKFGLFLLLNTLGIGGMGTVYKTIDLSLNRYLALKILRAKLAANPEFIERFTREARSAAAVNHPNVAQVYSFGELDGQYYLAMELLERGSLDDRITREGKIPENGVLEIGSAIASGLRAALQRGLLHRDIKPGNILFTQEGVPKIVDFGLARGQADGPEIGADGKPAQEEQIWGTPYYIAPEELRGQPDDFRSDIYSLGATLFHALAGRPPFEAETADEVVSKQASQPAFSLKTYTPTVQEYTAHVIARMLAKNPAERYNSYDELIRDLHEAKAILNVAQTAPGLVAPTGERVSVVSIVGTVAALAICGVVVWFVWAKRHDWFGMERAVPTSSIPSSTGMNAVAKQSKVNESGELEFPEDADWMKAWNTAALQMAQGRYQEALQGYENTLLLLGPNQPQHRAWIYFFEGLAVLAADQPAEADRVLLKAVDLHTGKDIPEKVTTGNFASPLAKTTLGTISVTDLESAIPRLPPWAAALARLTTGFAYMKAGDSQKAADAFRQYHQLPRAETNRWAFNLQPLAPKLAGRCDEAAATLAQIDALQKEQKFATALDAVHAASTNATLTGFRAALIARETELNKALGAERDQMERLAAETDRQRKEQEAREQQRFNKDKQQLQTTESNLNTLWQSYDFWSAVARYDALASNIETTQGKRLLQSRQAAARLLAEFKAQLSAAFERRPYTANDLQSRDGAQLTGRLTRATDKQLAFTTQYGEVLTDWGDLAPQTLIKLAVFYSNAFASSERPDARARRYLFLAVFCRQYGLDRSANGYLRQAEQIQPSLQQEADVIFGGASN